MRKKKRKYRKIYILLLMGKKGREKNTDNVYTYRNINTA
jgi:hypothetical protein